MNQLIVFLLIIVIAGIGFLAYIFMKRKPEPEKKDDSSMLMMQQQLNDIRQTLDLKLSESNNILQNSNKAIQMQSGQNVKLFGDVSERLARLDETNRQVINVTDQIKNLQDILKNPKQRGILGEYYLETVLKNVLPPDSYQMQYEFEDGTIVDAAVFIDKRIIPIDSKFSLENYNRILEASESDKKKYESAFVSDLKLRIDETSKYVKPDEKTMDFAFMFIPSEAVYYDLLVNKVGAVTEDTNNLIQYAGKKKVLIVSPTSFLAYLQTVLQGLRYQKISEQTEAIRKGIEKLRKHYFAYSQFVDKIGGNLSATVSSYNKAGKELAKIGKDMVKVTGGETDDLMLEVGEVEKPNIEQ